MESYGSTIKASKAKAIYFFGPLLVHKPLGVFKYECLQGLSKKLAIFSTLNCTPSSQISLVLNVCSGRMPAIAPLVTFFREVLTKT